MCELISATITAKMLLRWTVRMVVEKDLLQSENVSLQSRGNFHLLHESYYEMRELSHNQSYILSTHLLTIIDHLRGGELEVD